MFFLTFLSQIVSLSKTKKKNHATIKYLKKLFLEKYINVYSTIRKKMFNNSNCLFIKNNNTNPFADIRVLWIKIHVLRKQIRYNMYYLFITCRNWTILFLFKILNFIYPILTHNIT